jgi:hypothetical protein
MMGFYPSPDRYNWPITINSANKFVQVIEDPGGGNETTITTSVPESNVLIGTNTDYYAVGGADPATPTSAGNVVVLNATDDTLTARPLYDEIADVLTTASSNDGTNSLTYQFEAITPSGSSQTNSGVRLTTSGGTVDIQLDFSVSNAIDPRFFGFEQGKSDTTSAGTTVDGPYSRFGSWQSPVSRQHDKRRRVDQETFASSPHPYEAKTWRYVEPDRIRRMEYIGVAGVHVWEVDRADRSAEASRGGVPTDDANNALWCLWRNAAYDDRKMLVAVNAGDGDLSTELSSTGEQLNVGKLSGEFRSMFKPQEMTDREHAGEKYDLQIPMAIADPDSYSSNVSAYRH